MGFLTNLANKAKGVFGRVVNGVAKYAPKVGGVLNRLGDMTGIPLMNWLGKAANVAGGVAGMFKNKDYGGAVNKIKDTINNTKAPDITESVQRGKDFIKGEVDKFKHKILPA